MPIPVPPVPSGYRLGSGSAPIQIEVFIDLECPFSKKAWPTMLALINQDEGDRLSITAQPMVLCDHRQSWDLTKTLTAIADGDALTAWKFIGHLYQHQHEYDSEAFQNQTRQDLFELIEQLVQSFDSKVGMPELMSAAKDDRGDLANRAKSSIRYAISRGVWSTPTFLINGIKAPQLQSSSTIKDWEDFLNSL